MYCRCNALVVLLQRNGDTVNILCDNDMIRMIWVCDVVSVGD